MKEDKQFTAIVYHCCPICGKKDDGEILIHMRFGDLSAVDGKNIGYSDKPCSECQKIFDAGAIALIVADQEKSGATPEELYRCGAVFGMSEDWVRRCLTGDILESVLKKRVLVMDYKDAKAIGLTVNYPR